MFDHFKKKKDNDKPQKQLSSQDTPREPLGYVTTEEIKDYLFYALIDSGVMCDAADLELTAEIFFEYLVELGVIDEEDVEVYEIDDEEDDD